MARSLCDPTAQLSINTPFYPTTWIVSVHTLAFILSGVLEMWIDSYSIRYTYYFTIANNHQHLRSLPNYIGVGFQLHRIQLNTNMLRNKLPQGNKNNKT